MATATVTFEVGGGRLWQGELSTDHAASSYGQPVAILEGKAYGVGDVCEGLFLGRLPVSLVDCEDGAEWLVDAWQRECQNLRALMRPSWDF